MLDEKYIKNLKEYLSSGQLEEDFKYSSEERRYEILDFLEEVIELGELADQVATNIIFKNSQLSSLFKQ